MEDAMKRVFLWIGLLGFGFSGPSVGADANGDLLEAVRSQSVERLKAALGRRADVNVRDDHGNTPLIRAFDGEFWSLPIVRTLIETGADANAINDRGFSALMAAAYLGAGAAVEILIAERANTRGRDDTGRTPLIYALEKWLYENGMVGTKQPDPATIRRLVGAGADVNATDRMGRTPLMYALLWGPGDRTQEIVKFLLSSGADVRPKDTKGWTAIMLAAEHGPSAMEALLRGAGADLEADLKALGAGASRRYYGTWLDRALREGDLELAGSLLSQGKAVMAVSVATLASFARASAEARVMVWRYGPKEVVSGQINLLDYYLDNAVRARVTGSLDELRRDAADCPYRFPLATTFLHDDKDPVRYSFEKAFDNDLKTSWVEGVEGDGVGQKIAFLVDRAARRIAILPGYGEKQWYGQNNRVGTARLTLCYLVTQSEMGIVRCGLGASSETELSFEDRMELQEFEIVPPKPALPFPLVGILEITSVYATANWHDTCIAEIQLLDEKGRRIAR
jgi:ankyrin repeat protein